jgi:lipid-binding SYLF domain-containing protein
MLIHNRIIARLFAAILCTALLLPVARIATAQAPTEGPQEEPPLTPAEKEAARKERLKIAADGLEKLYKLTPEARAAVEKAAGYAVFDVTSIYAIFFVGQRGQGALFDNETKQLFYMSSLRAGTGPGIGKQRVYQVFIFKSKGAMEQFMAAGGTGADVTASVSTGTGGGVRSFNPSIDIYQIPESGAALQASWGGTVYSVDRKLDD